MNEIYLNKKICSSLKYNHKCTGLCTSVHEVCMCILQLDVYLCAHICDSDTHLVKLARVMITLATNFNLRAVLSSGYSSLYKIIHAVIFHKENRLP